ncbi:MAG: T9SS type B sorting domain-containing protein, partial [Flavobacterium sp.]
NIQITGQNLKWYDTSFSAAVLPNTTLLEDNKTYYVSQTIGCESDRTPILVQVYDTALPTGSTSKQYCIDENATIASIGIVGTNLKWYDSAINGSTLPETTLLQSTTYYATQTENNCESKRLAVTVKIQDTQPPTAASPQRFCIQKKASLNDIDITGENIKWFDSVSSDISLSGSTPLENGITYYASQTINSCESDRIPITIQILETTTGDCINFVDELPYPKYFTPNNDTFHDTWTIDFAYLAPNTGIRIFDRYGKFIKELHNNGAWDGTYLGSQEPAADYWFTVTRLNGTEFRGHFSLKR